MKNKKLRRYAVLLLMPIVFASCEDDIKTTTIEKLAADASKEFCDCLKNKSMQECEDELNFRYGSNAGNDEFIAEFNRVNSCGITIKKKNSKSLKPVIE